MNRHSTDAFVDELAALGALTQGQLSKVAEVCKYADGPSSEDAEDAVRSLRRLEAGAPSKGKLLRGAAVGALVGPIANLAMRAAGGPEFRGGKRIFLGKRPLMAQAAHGAIFGGLMPAAQHKIETEVQKSTLRKYIGEHDRGKLPQTIKKNWEL